MIRNEQQHPELRKVSYGRLSLGWTHHARFRAMQKSVAELAVLNVTAGSIVEIEQHDQQVTKLVVRIAQSAEWDAVYVIVPSTRLAKWTVVTCWLNAKDDQHFSLDFSRLG